MSFGSSEDEYAKEIGPERASSSGVRNMGTDQLVVGRVIPASGIPIRDKSVKDWKFSDDVDQPFPAPRDKTEDWDMRAGREKWVAQREEAERRQVIMDEGTRRRGIAANHRGESDVRKLPGGSYIDDRYEDDRYEVLRAERPETMLNNPSPHAARDKTEEHDMRDRSAPLGVEDAARVDSQGQPYNVVSKDSRTMAERAADSMKTQAELDIVERLGQGADGGGLRLNAGKNRIELLPPEWLWALADVMTQGSKKYDARNWERGMDWSSMIGCMYRHIAKFQAGQRFDGEGFDKGLGTTGCHELAMVAWNALALMVYDIRNIGNNDLPIIEQLDLFNDVNASTSNLETRWEHDRITPPEPGEAS